MSAVTWEFVYRDASGSTNPTSTGTTPGSGQAPGTSPGPEIPQQQTPQSAPSETPRPPQTDAPSIDLQSPRSAATQPPQTIVVERPAATVEVPRSDQPAPVVKPPETPGISRPESGPRLPEFSAPKSPIADKPPSLPQHADLPSARDEQTGLSLKPASSRSVEESLLNEIQRPKTPDTQSRPLPDHPDLPKIPEGERGQKPSLPSMDKPVSPYELKAPELPTPPIQRPSMNLTRQDLAAMMGSAGSAAGIAGSANLAALVAASGPAAAVTAGLGIATMGASAYQQEVESLSQFSPELAKANAEAEVKETQRLMEQARKYGEIDAKVSSFLSNATRGATAGFDDFLRNIFSNPWFYVRPWEALPSAIAAAVKEGMREVKEVESPIEKFLREFDHLPIPEGLIEGELAYESDQPMPVLSGI